MTTETRQVPLRQPDGKLIGGTGQSLNPGGRSLQTVLNVDAYLRELVGTRPKYLEKLVEAAERGDHRAIEYLTDRLAGKPVQTQLNINVATNWTDALQALAGGPGLQQAAPPRAELVDGELVAATTT